MCELVRILDNMPVGALYFRGFEIQPEFIICIYSIFYNTACDSFRHPVDQVKKRLKRGVIMLPHFLPAVLADGLQVQLVLVNLLQNAIQSVCGDEASDRCVRVHAEKINGEVQVCVSDRGPGVPSQQVEAIFEPLHSAKSGGMGMGLSICRDIIDAHGGRLWYAPNPAGGAIFCFTLHVASHDKNT